MMVKPLPPRTLAGAPLPGKGTVITTKQSAGACHKSGPALAGMPLQIGSADEFTAQGGQKLFSVLIFWSFLYQAKIATAIIHTDKNKLLVNN